MSKTEEKSSKHKEGEARPKKEKKEKKEKKVKKSKVLSEDVPVESAEPATTADVDMTLQETPAEASIPSDDTKSKKRKRSKETTDGDEAPTNDADLLEIDPDAPTPLSKAQARAARKESKRKSKAGDDEEADASEGDDGAERASKRAKKSKPDAPVKPKRQHSVWIGNLAFKTTAESLKAWIEREIILLSKGKPQAEDEDEDEEPEEGDDDEVDEETEIVTRVNMPMKQGRFGTQNQGSVSWIRWVWGPEADCAERDRFAYVDFKSRRFQKLGVRLSEGMIDGRRLLIKYGEHSSFLFGTAPYLTRVPGDDYGAKPDARTPKPVTSIPAGALPKSQPHNASTTLFLGNLPFDATEEAIWDFVERNAVEALKGRKKSKKGKGKRGKKGGEGEGSDSGSENESEDDDDDEEEEEEEEELADDDAKAILENKTKQSQASGLRRVRMPLFEDSGKCKGYVAPSAYVMPL